MLQAYDPIEGDAGAADAQKPEPSSQAVLRLLEANRTRFDSCLLPPGALDRKMAAAEAALLQSRREAELLQTRITALETSTSWRLTAPLRRILSLFQAARPAPGESVQTTPRELNTCPPAFAVSAPSAYDEWIERYEPVGLAKLLAVLPGQQPVHPQRLGIVLLPGADGLQSLHQLQCVCPQTVRILALTQASDELGSVPLRGTVLQRVPDDFTPADAVAWASRCLDADMLCFLDPRDSLAPSALALIEQITAGNPDADILYADEDWLIGGKRARPFFKPNWDADLQNERDLLGPFSFLRANLVREAIVSPGATWLYDLANQVAAATRPERIQHICAVLCHRGAPPFPSPMQVTSGAELLRTLPPPAPMVSVIVPNRDHAEFLSVCADAILHRTDYQRLELLIVDNGSTTVEALELLDTLAKDKRVRVLREPGPFNWSRLNNLAAREANGDLLLLLNNDIDVLQPDWLSALVFHAMQPGVGAVGAKLLYPDGRVQHAGLTTDFAGIPRHLFRFEPGDSPGAFELMATARQVWAVTGACLAIRRQIFWEVGGLNEALPVAYNDVDLCMRLTAFGYRIVWTPRAVLEHRELGSRLPDHLPEQQARAREELDRLVRDWGQLVLFDPYLNPNLQIRQEQLCFVSAEPPPGAP